MEVGGRPRAPRCGAQDDEQLVAKPSWGPAPRPDARKSRVAKLHTSGVRGIISECPNYTPYTVR